MTTCCYVRAGGICSTEWQWQDELASALWCWVLDNELGWRHQSRYSNGRYRHAERDVTVTSRRCAHIPPHTEPLWSMTHIALSLNSVQTLQVSVVCRPDILIVNSTTSSPSHQSSWTFYQELLPVLSDELIISLYAVFIWPFRCLDSIHTC